MLEWILYAIGGVLAGRGLFWIWRANKKVDEILEILKEKDDNQDNSAGE